MNELINGAKLLCSAEDTACQIKFLPEGCSDGILQLEGNHWRIRTVMLHAFSDESDTLIEEKESVMFAKGHKNPIIGNIFFLDNILSGESVFLASEAPDYQTSTLNIKDSVVTLENGNYAIAIGFGKTSDIESKCRSYYKSSMINKLPLAMSNTWGDRNGYSRVCHDFILREIDAAKEIGIDIVQVDDGWQTGSTGDPNIWNELGRRTFKGNFWDLSESKFPNGLNEVTKAARDSGLKLGIWFAPDSENNYTLIDRDISVLKKAYDEWGVRFFKLDMYWIESKENNEQFLKLLKAVYSFGDDVAVQLDVTRNKRINYLCGKEYGNIFVENRYTLSQNAYPYRALRSLWSFSKYLPTTRFQFEIVNPDLHKDTYDENDIFAPSHYSMDYLFASVMLSNPLFWMELQFLPKSRREELAPIIKVWKEIRNDIASADISPIGERPTGRSFTGFKIKGEEKSYLLIFREAIEKDNFEFDLGEKFEIISNIISNTEIDYQVRENLINVKFAKQRSYALLEVK